MNPGVVVPQLLSCRIAFLLFNDAMVDTYSLPIYNPTGIGGAIVPFTSEDTMRYATTDHNNPIVSTHILDLRFLVICPRPTPSWPILSLCLDGMVFLSFDKPLSMVPSCLGAMTMYTYTSSSIHAPLSSSCDYPSRLYGPTTCTPGFLLSALLSLDYQISYIILTTSFHGCSIFKIRHLFFQVDCDPSDANFFVAALD